MKKTAMTESPSLKIKIKTLKTDFTLILVSWVARMKGSKEVSLVS